MPLPSPVSYTDAIVRPDRRASSTTVRGAVAAGDGLLSAEMLEYWRAHFRLPAQAQQTAIYARLGLVADIVGGGKTAR